jgi:hypothetical protein
VIGDVPSGSYWPGSVVQADGFVVNSLSLSGDGSTLWAVLYNQYEAEVVDRWQVWSMPTLGGNATQSGVAIPERVATRAASPSGRRTAATPPS